MARWKQYLANETQQLYNSNIEELKRRQREHEASIKHVQNDILLAEN